MNDADKQKNASHSLNSDLKHIIFIDNKIVYHFYGELRNYKYKKYKIREDNAAPTHSKSQKHIHIYKNDEWVVINQDGSRSHSDGGEIELPQKLFDFIKRKFPDWSFPEDRIIRIGNMPIPAIEINEIIKLKPSKTVLVAASEKENAIISFFQSSRLFLHSANILFNDPLSMISGAASFLSHLGIELLLKACWIWVSVPRNTSS
jgi:hypothetical protein